MLALAALGIAWVVVADTAAAALPLVDPSLRELRTCPITAAAFSDDQHGWLADYCGCVFESHDAGETWAELAGTTCGAQSNGALFAEAIAKFVWSSPTTGIALTLDRTAYRTSDAGATWQAIKVPGEQVPYSTAQIGHRMWICGSSGIVVRSDDAGLTWLAVNSPFGYSNPCTSLSFIDEAMGWGRGENGAIFQTDDAGETWTEINSPGRDAYGRAALIRWTRELGWASAKNGLFRTVDGGLHWTPVPLLGMDQGHVHVTSESGRALLTFNRSDDPSALVPVLDTRVARRGTQGVMTWSNERVFEYFRNGERVRSTPVLTRSGAEGKELLIGVSSIDARRRFGWSAGRVYHSEDGGSTWFVVGAVPSRIDRLAFLNERAAVLESAGHLKRSEDGGRTWLASPNADWDRYELNAASGPASSPLECTYRADTGMLLLELGYSGCFVLRERTLSVRLDWHGESARVTSTPGRFAEQPRTRSMELPLAAARAVAERIAAAAARPEVPSRCSSLTDRPFARVVWSCGGAQHELWFETSDFDCRESSCQMMPGEQCAALVAKLPADGSYARATGLGKAAAEAIQSLHAFGEKEPEPR